MQTGLTINAAPTLTPDTSEPPSRVDIYPPSPTAAAAKPGGFFSEQGPSFRDILDAINPLNHIPIVSSLFEEATGHKASTVSRLAGGALLGGPIGFVASLASVIFESEIGASPAETLYAAMTGDKVTPASTQVAQADQPPQGSTTQVADAQINPAIHGDAALALASLEPSTQAALATAAQTASARTTTDAAQTIANSTVLSLYGDSGNSAHASYKKAQLLPYLKDVTVSRVL